jgi:hypothetical protein
MHPSTKSATMTCYTDRHATRQRPRSGTLPCLFVLPLLLLRPCQADICFLLYQNADNLLENSLRDNLKHWIHSPAIQDPTVTTWVYFDALNNVAAIGDTAESQIPTTPLEDVWTTDGSQLLTEVSANKFEGSMYLTFDHDDQKMKVVKEIGHELDSDDPATLWGFVGFAMEHCLSRGAHDTFLILNGYGEGSQGFGGDLNPVRQRQRYRRNLEPKVKDAKREKGDVPTTRTNSSSPLPPADNKQITEVRPLDVEPHQDIVMALSQVLKDLHGGPAKFSVLGFEGHFMQTFQNLNAYKTITKYMLASESLMPDHGE